MARLYSLIFLSAPLAGMILTTGTFSEDAKREELIDGTKLVELFESVQLGVQSKTVYEVDLKFFEPFMN